MREGVILVGVGLFWLAIFIADLVITTAVIYAIGHWVLGVW